MFLSLSLAISLRHVFISHHFFVLFYFSLSEKDCWSPSEHFNWINWYNRYVGAIRRRPSSVWNIDPSIVLLANALCFHGYWMIVWFSVLLQPRNYSPCFNDHNHFVKEGSRYIINGVMKVAFGIQSGYNLLFLKTRDTKDPKNRCLVGLSPERGFSNIILKQPEFGNKATKALFRFQWELIWKLKNKTVAVLYYTKHVFWC